MPPAPPPQGRTFTVVIDQARLDEDLAHNTAAAAATGRGAAERFRRRGSPARCFTPARLKTAKAPTCLAA
ncbi:MAG: hypothetical protein ACR2OB_13945 [Solirubrobacteraceae bacterium]